MDLDAWHAVAWGNSCGVVAGAHACLCCVPACAACAAAVDVDWSQVALVAGVLVDAPEGGHKLTDVRIWYKVWESKGLGRHAIACECAQRSQPRPCVLCGPWPW